MLHLDLPMLRALAFPGGHRSPLSCNKGFGFFGPSSFPGFA
jgi:hypothetical protein